VGFVTLVAVVEPDELVTMNAVEGEDDHHQEIGDEQADVEGVPAIDVAECVVSVVRLPVVSQTARGEEHGERIELAEQRCLRFEKV
jgi:hypothetical protein